MQSPRLAKSLSAPPKNEDLLDSFIGALEEDQPKEEEKEEQKYS